VTLHAIDASHGSNLGGFMRDLTNWIPARWGIGRGANHQPSAGDAEAQISYSELDLRWPAFTEDGMLRIDPESRKVIEIRLAFEQKTGPPVQDEKARNGHDVVSMITRETESLREARLQVEALACANRRKDEFLAILSHELRTPLASIQYAVRFLGTPTGEDATRQRMQALIERQLHRMGHLVDELLDVSRITSGHLDLRRERLDLREVVSHAIEALQWDLFERHHRLTTELPDAPVWLQADRGRLEQVFVNLLANASRYTDGGGQLALRVHTEDGEAVIRVRDSGMGIAPEALPDLFDLFKQGNAADPRSKPGLGVGLAVVRNLVELHGGSVTAASAGVGQGSEFTVRLPTAD
jgi:signal transduction histidine kinase